MFFRHKKGLFINSRLPITPFCPVSYLRFPTILTILISRLITRLQGEKTIQTIQFKQKHFQKKERPSKGHSHEISDEAPSKHRSHTPHIFPLFHFRLQLECCMSLAAYTIIIIPLMFVYKKKEQHV